MHVVQVSFFVDPERRPPEKLLHDWHSLVDVAAATATACERVTVVQASMVPGLIERSGIAFHFLAPDNRSSRLTRGKTFRTLLRDLAPDVVHVHGLGFSHELHQLRALLPKVPILLQDHADRVPRFWRRRSWRRGAAIAAGVSFCARSQAEPFLRSGLLSSRVHIFEIPESTSTFVPGEQGEARAATGLQGNPAILWVGHLDANKDPLTVLKGVSAATHALPELQLWCCYGTAPLLPAVQKRVVRDAALRDRVHLLGPIPHARVEQLMQAADLFVLGSRREGCSFALIEALSTGLLPVATDIPSSRSLTGNGAIGVLWKPGDWRSLSGGLQAAASAVTPKTREAVRAHFEAKLSSSALGREFATAYRRLVEACVSNQHAAAKL